ncbi:MAG TPA: 5-amino-6-(D-ribitylamino)uracil--L-tyrosine 4-hydroxyphenyl transferase CofH [Xanthobacteraceae bacterium]|jgi:FO synthase
MSNTGDPFDLLDADAASLIRRAGALRDDAHGAIISYSRKVFIPLTRLCRDVCGYCTFATTPRLASRAYLTREEVLGIARAGAAAGCKEALFTIGDKPELRYALAREELDALGHASTLSLLAEMAKLVLNETGLLPHINAGIMAAPELKALRKVSASQGLMLESASERLCRPGGPHYGSPDKQPRVRLDMIETAGALSIPFTTGILIGIGETRRERIEALLAIRDSHRRHGHIQEVIIQNFRAKPDTRMARAPEPSAEEMLWTVAAARLALDPAMSIQAPPNLNLHALEALIAAGINDWGGVSPVTRDHVNPEAAWPEISALEAVTAASGKTLLERLTIYPSFALDPARWTDAAMRSRVLLSMDSEGFARAEQWAPGEQASLPQVQISHGHRRGAFNCAVGAAHAIGRILDRAVRGCDLSADEIVSLFKARAHAFTAVCEAADEVRKRVNGDSVSYVVTRNINYTNVCYFHCAFCAFSKGKRTEHLRGPAYVLDLAEVVRRAREAWERGATEVCLQGGIHPQYTGRTYIDICRAIKAEVPGIHIHAFSPLEISQGAATLGLSVAELLRRLRNAGLATLPGTAAEILDDEVRQVICPDKISTDQWLSVIETAHRQGLRTTATIMFGHVDRPIHWAMHLLALRKLQRRTGGFTELVPLPFVPMEAPIFLRGGSRRGPTFREAVLMHAVARLALHPFFENIQVSWPKMGPEGAAVCLSAGCNDLGGTLMNESISRAAGAAHGQELAPPQMEALIRKLGRVPRQRTTLYDDASSERTAASWAAAPLLPVMASHSPPSSVRANSRPRRPAGQDVA